MKSSDPAWAIDPNIRHLFLYVVFIPVAGLSDNEWTGTVPTRTNQANKERSRFDRVNYKKRIGIVAEWVNQK